ncbi:MAG: isopentenyl phosphate kinase [Haloarculaceae archaeon]
MTTVLKLGGSVITDKEREGKLDEDRLDAAAAAVAAAAEDLVLVHGGGSFAHPRAEAHGVTDTDGTDDAAAVTDVHDAMTDLSDAVVGALQERGVPALPVATLPAASRDASGALSLPAGTVERMLGEGFLPVAHADPVVQEGAGATILSGDEIVTSLARSLGADRVGLCSEVPGVLDADGTVVGRVESWADVADVLGGSAGTDVTGGMAGKVRTLLDLSVPAHVFGPDGLESFLDGGSPGTEIRGGSPPS